MAVTYPVTTNIDYALELASRALVINANFHMQHFDRNTATQQISYHRVNSLHFTTLVFLHWALTTRQARGPQPNLCSCHSRRETIQLLPSLVYRPLVSP